VPNAQTFLDALARHTLVRPKEKTSKDIINLEQLSSAEQETRLLELAESGDKIAAITMARRLYNYDLTQAKELLEGLVNKHSPQG
jgi:ribosomal protein L7/L12